MAGDTMSRIFQAIAPLLLIVSGCSGAAPGEPPLAGARIGGPFALTDPAGKTVRDTDFAGKYRLVYFGYTWCPDICPNDMLKIGQAMKTLDKQAPDKAKAIVPIFITVDPERDTPKVVGEFVRNFDDRIIGLTGTPAAIQDVTKQYAVYAKKEAPGPDGVYLVGHSQIAYLMDRDGKPITSLPIEKDAPALVAELEHWVK
jgi:protein SCO1